MVESQGIEMEEMEIRVENPWGTGPCLISIKLVVDRAIDHREEDKDVVTSNELLIKICFVFGTFSKLFKAILFAW